MRKPVPRSNKFINSRQLMLLVKVSMDLSFRIISVLFITEMYL
jgi:hypothetical protein